jgi:transposase
MVAFQSHSANRSDKHAQWFVQLLRKRGHEVSVGDAAQIRASYVRKQKIDRTDAKHILQPLIEGQFPRTWLPSAEMRDRRQLLVHRQSWCRYARGSRMSCNTRC